MTTDLSLDEDQRTLVATVRDLLAKQADSAAVRAADGLDEPLWRRLAEEIGVAALPVAEEYGGAGASLVESALVLEEVGRSLAPVPLLGSVVAAHATTDPEILERIAGGEICAVVLAPGEPVLYGAEAALVLDISGERTRLVAAGPTDVASPVAAVDPTLRLAQVSSEPGSPVAGDPAHARRAALVGVSALAVGCAQRGLEMTVSYSKERHQFGRAIGSFQALKHRMAEMLVLVETSRSAAYCKQAATRVAAETIQLHGGIAITWEHDAHLVFKRAHALSQLGGAPERLREQALAARL